MHSVTKLHVTMNTSSPEVRLEGKSMSQDKHQKLYTLFKKRERFMEKRLTMLLMGLFLMVGGALAQTKVSGTVVS